MVEKLIKLHNTLVLIETKGENTKIMADCLRFTEQLIAEANTAKVAPAEEKEE